MKQFRRWLAKQLRALARWIEPPGVTIWYASADWDQTGYALTEFVEWGDPDGL